MSLQIDLEGARNDLYELERKVKRARGTKFEISTLAVFLVVVGFVAALIATGAYRDGEVNTAGWAGLVTVVCVIVLFVCVGWIKKSQQQLKQLEPKLIEQTKQFKHFKKLHDVTPEGLRKLIEKEKGQRAHNSIGWFLLFASLAIIISGNIESELSPIWTIVLMGVVFYLLHDLRSSPSKVQFYQQKLREAEEEIDAEQKRAATASAEEQRPKDSRRVLARYLPRLKKIEYDDVSRLEHLIDDGISPKDLEDDILAALDEKPRKDEEQELRAEWDLEGDLEAADIEGRITAVEKVVNRQKDQIVRVEDWRKEGRITDEEADRLIEKLNSWAETTIQDIMGAQR